MCVLPSKVHTRQTNWTAFNADVGNRLAHRIVWSSYKLCMIISCLSLASAEQPTPFATFRRSEPYSGQRYLHTPIRGEGTISSWPPSVKHHYSASLGPGKFSIRIPDGAAASANWSLRLRMPNSSDLFVLPIRNANECTRLRLSLLAHAWCSCGLVHANVTVLIALPVEVWVYRLEIDSLARIRAAL